MLVCWEKNENKPREAEFGTYFKNKLPNALSATSKQFFSTVTDENSGLDIKQQRQHQYQQQ